MRSIDIVITISQCITPPKAPFLGHSCVGYNNANMQSDGQILTAQFLSVGQESAKKFKLSDLSVTGYQDNETLQSEYGLGGTEFVLCPLTAFGGTLDSKKYMWSDSYDPDDTHEWSGGFWDGPGDPDEELADFGAGYWFYVDYTPFAEEQIKLVSAGAVPPIDLAYELKDDGNVIGNAMPAPVTLADVTISGYQVNETLQSEYGLGGTEFVLCPLTAFGGTVDSQKYMWSDSYDPDDTHEWAGGYWDGPGDPAEFAIAPGQCFWVYVDYTPFAEEKILFEIPSPIVDHTSAE